MKISVARDYSEYTGLRYCNISQHSGEDFYHTVLNPKFAEAYENGEDVELIIDGTQDGIGPSFLDESIGNLVYDFTLDVVASRLKIISNELPQWLDMIKEETYPTWEERRKTMREAKVTKSHAPWFRLVEGKLVKDEWIKFRDQ